MEGGSTEFDVGVVELCIASRIRRPEISNIEIDSVEKIQIEKEIWKNKTIISLSNGNQVPVANCVKKFQDELHHQGKVSEIVTKRYEIIGARLINEQTNSFVKINAIIFTGILTKVDSTSKLRFTLVDKVWLVMKSLF